MIDKRISSYEIEHGIRTRFTFAVVSTEHTEFDVHHLTPLTLVLNWTNDPNLRRR